MSVHQKLGMILKNKMVQKLSLEKIFLTKKQSPKLISFNKMKALKIDFESTILALFDQPNRNPSTHFRKKFPLNMLILGQKSCFLEPTIFKIPQPN